MLEEHKAQENLISEKELLQQELKAKREEFEARQKLENEVSEWITGNDQYKFYNLVVVLAVIVFYTSCNY